MAKSDSNPNCVKKSSPPRQGSSKGRPPKKQQQAPEQGLPENEMHLRKLMSELILVEDRERRKLASILHDGLQQTLAAAKFSLGLIRDSRDIEAAISATRALVDEAIQTCRSLASDLSPVALANPDIVSSMSWLVRWMYERYGLTVRMIADCPVDCAPREAAILLFQATRELLFNVVKHAHVDTADLRVRVSDEHIEISVSDEGVGFDPDRVQTEPAVHGGSGLAGIRERIECLGGRLLIGSEPGCGSRLQLILPAVMARGKPGKSAGMVSGLHPGSGSQTKASLRRFGRYGRCRLLGTSVEKTSIRATESA